jgi:hypothetical protein
MRAGSREPGVVGPGAFPGAPLPGVSAFRDSRANELHWSLPESNPKHFTVPPPAPGLNHVAPPTPPNFNGWIELPHSQCFNTSHPTPPRAIPMPNMPLPMPSKSANIGHVPPPNGAFPLNPLYLPPAPVDRHNRLPMNPPNPHPMNPQPFPPPPNPVPLPARNNEVADLATQLGYLTIAPQMPADPRPTSTHLQELYETMLLARQMGPDVAPLVTAASITTWALRRFGNPSPPQEWRLSIRCHACIFPSQ